jgi:spermidine synthase
MSPTTSTEAAPVVSSVPARVDGREAPANPVLLVLLLLFFVSGACGLIYQQLWLRELSLVFGVTLYAVATVLAAFFSGLALGSFLAGRYADRARRPLLGYAVVEVLVGVLALATPGDCARSKAST